ncbi:hypothetical protein ABEB36_000047 [Hypothenemus hampei]|uniref:Uncharacterized protein n=1 Tax=Hypothenemus hampei TaxID=57062 RepID=A0ABD1FA34_HYPHA
MVMKSRTFLGQVMGSSYRSVTVIDSLSVVRKFARLTIGYFREASEQRSFVDSKQMPATRAAELCLPVVSSSPSLVKASLKFVVVYRV